MGKATAVVIMAVGKDGDIYAAQVYAQLSGVFGKNSRLSGIKKDAQAVGFDVETQTMFGGEAVFGCIFS
jgi:hypothetical protein